MSSLSASSDAVPPEGADAPIPVEVRRQAVQWRLDLQSDHATEELRGRWQQWRAAHPDHERAWQRIESSLSTLRGQPSPLVHAVLDTPGTASRRQIIKALGLVVFLGGTAWLVDEKTAWRHWMADRSTGTGERADITLPDGTRVQLNAGTAINVRFSATERLVRLLGGEILVETAHETPSPSGTNPSRPFIVQTAQGRIRPLGTRFTVRDLEGNARGASHVSVFDGAVELRPGDTDDQARVLRTGEQGRLTRAAAELAGPADEASTAWTRGMIVALDMPLADFLAELSRHRPGRLVCDPAVAPLSVSGTYALADTDGILEVLATSLPVQVRYLTRYWVTVLPAPHRRPE
ncbi:MAG: FecR family protein [Steroidobacteraceae bacterium]